VKAEEKSFSARSYRQSMWTVSRTSLKDICYTHMPEAWNQASDNGRLPTHWRQVFYVMRPLCDAHPESDRPLRDATFKVILEDYLADYRPGWDVLRGARGVFKEPHSAINDNGLPMSTMGVRGYLQAAAQTPNARLEEIASRFPTKGAVNRIAAVLICEKEGFDELLQQESVVRRIVFGSTAPPGRQHSRHAVQRIDAQPAVVGQRRQPRRREAGPCLDERVALERRLGLRRFVVGGDIVEPEYP
jgi:hypothetical protein